MVIRENRSSDPPISISEIPPSGGAPVGGFSDEDPFRRVIQFLKKRSWIVIVSALLGFLGGSLVNHFSQRAFTAQANIEVDAEDISSQFRLEQMQGLGGGEDISGKLDTEMEILRSRNLAMETIKELRLYDNPDFLHLVNGKPWDISKPNVRELLLANFGASLKIARLGHTDIVQIYATNRKPRVGDL